MTKRRPGRPAGRFSHEVVMPTTALLLDLPPWFINLHRSSIEDCAWRVGQVENVETRINGERAIVSLRCVSWGGRKMVQPSPEDRYRIFRDEFTRGFEDFSGSAETSKAA